MEHPYDAVLEAERALDAAVSHLAQMRQDFKALKVTLEPVLAAAARYGIAKVEFRFAVERYARGAA